MFLLQTDTHATEVMADEGLEELVDSVAFTLAMFPQEFIGPLAEVSLWSPSNGW